MNWIASNFMMNKTSSNIEKKKKLFNFCSFSSVFFHNFVVDTPFFMAFIFALLCGMTESQQELLHEEMEKSYIYVAKWIEICSDASCRSSFALQKSTWWNCISHMLKTKQNNKTKHTLQCSNETKRNARNPHLLTKRLQKPKHPHCRNETCTSDSILLTHRDIPFDYILYSI